MHGQAFNRRQFLAGTALAGVAPSLTLGRGAADVSGLRVGCTEADITPDIGMEQPGGYGKAFHKTLHDPCKVRAAVFENAGSRVALVSLDALVVPRSVVLDARREIRQRCGIPPEAVMIAATHSHSSGPTGMVQPGEYDHADSFVRQLAYEKSSCADAGYLDRVRAQLVDVVSRAWQGRVPARCSFGFGIEDKVAFNRRFRMKNGLTYTHPGKGNPDIVEVAGPVDPQVGVIGVWNEAGRLAGCVVNFACHGTTNPGGISANWIYYLEQTIRGVFGADSVVLFLPGTCGDVTQVNNLSPYADPQGEDWARFVGARVGAEAVKVLLSAVPGADVPLSAESKVLRISRRKPSAARLRRSLDVVRKSPEEAGQTEWTFAKEIVLLDALLKKAPEVDVETQAIQIGPVALPTSPAEYFCQFGLDLKKRGNFPLTFPVELANGFIGYVPTEEALGKRGGGYETRLTSYSNLVPPAGRQILEAGLELMARMTPVTTPKPDSAPPFRAPWSYGDVPPELD